MKEKRSIYGPLSIGSALLAFGLGTGSADLSHSEANNWTLVLAILALFLLGMGFGVAGMVRAEPLRWLPAVGFGFNIVLLAIGFVF